MSDQAASSLTNVLVAVLVARSVSASEFGAFGLTMVSYQLVNGLSRALVGEPFLAHHADDPLEVRRRVVAEVIGGALAVGATGALVVGGAGAIVRGLAGPGLIALAVMLPFLTVHDALRFSFVVDRPGRGLAIDLYWLLLVLVAMATAPDGASVAWFVSAWGVSGSVAMVLGLVLSQASTWRPRAIVWFRRTWSDGVRYAAEYLTAQATMQAAVLALWGVSTPATVGAVRASQTFYGPLNTLHLGVYLAVVPDGVRLRDRPLRLQRLMVLTGGALAAFALLWALVGLCLPDSLGVEIFGESWPGTDELMLPMGLWMVLGGTMAGGFLGLRSLGDARNSLRSRLFSAPGQLVLPIAGALMGGAIGFALGAAVGRLLASGIWWMAFRGALRRSDGSVGSEGLPAAVEEALPPVTADNT